MTMFPVARGSADVEMVGCMFMDVTDRVAAEQALAESERRRREILGSMLQAEDVERSRIATELHDDTVQVMAAALLALDRVSLVASRRGADALASAVSMARATLEGGHRARPQADVRAASGDPPRPGPLPGAPRPRRADREGGRRRGNRGRISRRYDLAVEELVYRCAHEALANVSQARAAETIVVNFADDDAVLRIDVRDDGCGFDVESVRSRPDAALHFGLDTMIERIRAAGGQAAIDSEVGSGRPSRSRCRSPRRSRTTAGNPEHVAVATRLRVWEPRDDG
jgi:signal transduction histidine kinase